MAPERKTGNDDGGGDAEDEMLVDGDGKWVFFTKEKYRKQKKKNQNKNDRKQAYCQTNKLNKEKMLRSINFFEDLATLYTIMSD